jgi:hypothetical protein
MFEKQRFTVLWVDCEASLSVDTSFCDIVTMLKLPKRLEGETSATNRFVVLEWLRTTGL